MVSRFLVDSHTRLPATSTTPPEKRRTTSPIMQIEQRPTTDQETQEKGCGSTSYATCKPLTSPATRMPASSAATGVVHVRYGKAKKGSPPKRRSVLTVFDWTPEVIADWLAHGQPYMDDGIDLFPSERGVLVSEDTLLRRFRRYCDDLGLSAGLDLHSLRRSYATHLIEDGWDPMFVQHQMGHEHASTTALYTCVSSDYRIRTLRAGCSMPPSLTRWH